MNLDGRDHGERPSCMLGQMVGGVPNMMMMNHNMNFNNMPMVMMGPDNSMPAPMTMGGMPGPAVGGQGMMGGMRGASGPAMGGLPLIGAQGPSTVLYPTPQDLQKLHRDTMNNATSNTMVLSLATFLQQWIHGYTQFDESCSVAGTLYITVDGRDKNKYCVNEKLYKSEGEMLNVLSNSFHAPNDVHDNLSNNNNTNRWSIGQETLPTPHEKDPFIEHQDSASLHDPDIWGGGSNDALNYSHKPVPPPSIQISTAPIQLLETIREVDKTKKKTISSPIKREPVNKPDAVKEEPRGETAMCEKCGESFPDRWSLLRHKSSHLLPRVQSPKCKTCGRRVRPCDYPNHKCVPKPREKLTCRFCGVSFIQIRSLKRHILTHGDEAPFKCDMCGKTFSQPSVFKLHMGIHTGELPYECKVCNRGYRNKLGLMKHEREHDDVKPFICEHCGLSFLTSSRLQEHLRTHKEPNQLTSQPYLTPPDARKTTVAAILGACPSCKVKDIHNVMDTLRVILPKNCDTLLCSVDKTSTSSMFDVTISVDLNTPDEISSWIDKFEESSMTTFKIRNTKNKVGPRVIYKQTRHCQHGGRNRGKGKYNITKRTNCEATFCVKLNAYNEKWPSNPHVTTHRATVNLKWKHNHTIEGAYPLIIPPRVKSKKKHFIVVKAIKNKSL